MRFIVISLWIAKEYPIHIKILPNYMKNTKDINDKLELATRVLLLKTHNWLSITFL